MKSLYLLVDIFTVLVPFLFSFHPRIQFYKHFKAFARAAFIVAVIFLIWDEWFVRMGVWSFNPRYVVGFYIGSLPIEEVLFFFCIPFSCVFTFYCLTTFYALRLSPIVSSIFCIAILFVCIVTGLIHYDKWYTASTCLSTAITCILLQYVLKVDWFGKALLVYGVLLIPFLIVNGILTGATTPEPVVIYNNGENLGIRIITIPVEDIFYGMTMYLLNVWLFRRWSRVDVKVAKKELLR